MEKYEKTDYQGIDYGLGQSNIDKETGIRYGVIPISHVSGFWDVAEPVYYLSCPICEQELTEIPKDLICPYCGEEIDQEEDIYSLEPVCWRYEGKGYILEADETDIFIIKSPYYTYAQFCSPCAPGACYLPNPLNVKSPSETWIEEFPNNKCYCLDKSWFDNDKAPYEYWEV